MNRLSSTLSSWREYYSRPSHTSTFASNGQLSPEEFVAAGDYLVYKFPTWSWQPAPESKRVAYLPDDKQYLLLRHAPCHSRLDDNFASGWNPGEATGEDEWEEGSTATTAKVKVVDEKGVEEEEEDDEDDEIPDMDIEEDDEAIIRESSKDKSSGGKGVKAPLRTYNLHITYSTYYRTPRFWLSGHDGTTRLPLSSPTLILEDIAPDYREKTVTIEEFPGMEGGVQMASVHPCRHAEAMKRIFDSMLRRKSRKNEEHRQLPTLEEEVGDMSLSPETKTDAKDVKEGEDWEEVVAGEMQEDDGLRVDQYLVVFVKFIAGVVPGVEMDYTMGI